MQSRMRPEYYLSQEIFDREQAKIFRKTWLFAGLKTLIPAHGNTMVRMLAGFPVTISNHHGEFQAHHGKAPQTIQAVGQLLFVNLASDPMPIHDQFSPSFFSSLESCSTAWGPEVLHTVWHAKFNWKLIFENLRDMNHVRFLHGGHFANYLEMTIPVPEQLAEEATQPLADTSAPSLRAELRRFNWGGATPALIPHRRKVPWHAMVQPWGGEDRYYDWQAYPNLHIASGNAGHSFTLECYTPVAPGRTDVELFWVMARKTQDFDFSAQALLANMHGSKKIVGEDIAMLEAIQHVLHGQAPMPHQGAYEAQNSLIERCYSALMDTHAEI